jgi:hypothetical protein
MRVRTLVVAVLLATAGCSSSSSPSGDAKQLPNTRLPPGTGPNAGKAPPAQ